jgi:hypothetical protein
MVSAIDMPELAIDLTFLISMEPVRKPKGCRRNQKCFGGYTKT